jgi:hypothetical protein
VSVFGNGDECFGKLVEFMACWEDEQFEEDEQFPSLVASAVETWYLQLCPTTLSRPPLRLTLFVVRFADDPDMQERFLRVLFTSPESIYPEEVMAIIDALHDIRETQELGFDPEFYLAISAEFTPGSDLSARVLFSLYFEVAPLC